VINLPILTKAPRNTQKVLPTVSHKNQYIERSVIEVSELFGYREIRTPVFEHTELFRRSVGDTTDVVQKEMYTFEDKGGRSLTLRPEGTAGVARAYLEHGLGSEPLPQKLCYLSSGYRYEKPQAGRLREFHQFGAECFGTAAPAADAEIIALADQIFTFLGIENLRLELNSIGCPGCRGAFQTALKDYFSSKSAELCETCQGRLERNPMRILDCKSPVCSSIAAGAPVGLDYICGDCAEHFAALKSQLDALGIEYTVNPKIVRGLDYYTRTVFEFISDEIGAQSTVCGGGRYDGLLEELGGQPTPALGFGMGLERILMLMEAQKTPMPEPKRCELYLIPAGETAVKTAAAIAFDLRAEGIAAQYDIAGRSVKAQMKFADKIKARYTAVIGDDELSGGRVKLKNMDTGDMTDMALDTLAEDFMGIALQQAVRDFEATIYP